MQQTTEDFCPLIKDKCLQFGCHFWVKLVGKHPQSGDPVDEWDCTFKWLPFLLIENSAQGRSTAAAVESFRNEMAKANAGLILLSSIGHAVKQVDYDGH